MLFLSENFCVKLLHTLQFASTLYRKYNYFGDVKITCNLWMVKNSLIVRTMEEESPCEVNEISISREFPTNIIESKYEQIASGIMDDIFNCYGLWKCPFFDGEGKFTEN